MNDTPTHARTHACMHARTLQYIQTVVTKQSLWQKKKARRDIEKEEGEAKWWNQTCGRRVTDDKFFVCPVSFSHYCLQQMRKWFTLTYFQQPGWCRWQLLARFSYWMKGLNETEQQGNTGSSLYPENNSSEYSHSCRAGWNTVPQYCKTDSQRTGAITKHINHKRALQPWLLCPQTQRITQKKGTNNGTVYCLQQF